MWGKVKLIYILCKFSRDWQSSLIVSTVKIPIFNGYVSVLVLMVFLVLETVRGGLFLFFFFLFSICFITITENILNQNCLKETVA